MGDKFYIILNGCVAVMASGKKLAEISEGNCFGEVALISQSARTATICGVSDTVLLSLTAVQFKQFMDSVPHKREEVQHLAQQRIASRLRCVPMISDLSDHALELLVALMQLERHPSNTVLFKEGDDGHKLYMVLKGQVSVLVDGQAHAVRTVGDVFGEAALLEDWLCYATVRTEEDSLFAVLSRENFGRHTGQHYLGQHYLGQHYFG